MKNIKSTDELKAAILQLENRQIIQEQLLKEQFNIVYNSLKPLNLIKNTIRDLISSKEIQEDIIGYAGNVVADFVSKQFFKGSSENYVKKYARQLIHNGITTIISLYSGTIRDFGESLINKFLDRNKKT